MRGKGCEDYRRPGRSAIRLPSVRGLGVSSKRKRRRNSGAERRRIVRRISPARRWNGGEIHGTRFCSQPIERRRNRSGRRRSLVIGKSGSFRNCTFNAKTLGRQNTSTGQRYRWREPRKRLREPVMPSSDGLMLWESKSPLNAKLPYSIRITWV